MLEILSILKTSFRFSDFPDLSDLNNPNLVEIVMSELYNIWNL